MTFLSYAQNFEDVMLWRALKHVKNGVYVDVGAQHPVVDSVSKAFYEQGWRGIHIEPVLEYAELLRNDRPDEIVLQVALGEMEGVLELNVISGTGLSTAVDAFADRHQIERGFEARRIQVPVLTLKSALKSLIGKDVHWLKIDVEGFEAQVLRGWDSKILRPWIMVVEATIPNSPEVDYARWDPILINADYRFVYFDGLNRFYVANEHAKLFDAFSCPPNVFDDIDVTEKSQLCRRVIAAHLGSEATLNQRAEQFESELNTLKIKLNELNSVELKNLELYQHNQWMQAELVAINVFLNELNSVKLKNLELYQHNQWIQTELDVINTRALQHEQQLAAVYVSTSWRMTRPVRAFKRALQYISAAIGKARNAVHRAKPVTKTAVLRSARFLVAQPQVRKAAVRTRVLFPSLDAKMRKLFLRIQHGAYHAGIDHGNLYQHSAAPDQHSPEPDQHALPLSARKVLAALRRGADKNNQS